MKCKNCGTERGRGEKFQHGKCYRCQKGFTRTQPVKVDNEPEDNPGVVDGDMRDWSTG